jgi:hypothetical protein
MRQAKLDESNWVRNQPNKVIRPAESSFAFMGVIAGVERKKGDRRPYCEE